MQPLSYITGEKIVRADDCQGVSLAAQAKEIDLHCFGRYKYPCLLYTSDAADE